MEIKISESCGNVFEDLGRPEPNIRLIKTDLVIAIEKRIQEQGLKLSQAADICNIDPGTLSKVLKRKPFSITIDRLIRWLVALGAKVTIVIE